MWLACVKGPAAPVICSISFLVSWRAPVRLSTRLLLSFDMKFSFSDFGVSSPNIPDKNQKLPKCFAKASEQLCIYVAVWIADRAGHKHGETSRNKAAGNLIQFFLGQLTSANPAKYAIVIIRHNFLLSSVCHLNLGEFYFVEALLVGRELGIPACIRIAGWAC